MAREILFKAKRIDNGEWVEGSLLVDEAGNCYMGVYIFPRQDTDIVVVGGRINGKTYKRFSGIGFTQVDSKTVCQYTGLTDKNGNKIWENDVVRHLEHGEIYKCYWYCENCEYSLCNESESFGLGYCVGTELEVIGNIFDNPEVLGGGE